MSAHIFDIALKITMAAGLLSIVALLVLPFLTFFQSAITPGNGRHALEIISSQTGYQKRAIARAKMLTDKGAGEIVEVVATGNGISILFESSTYKQDILQLMSKGVCFTICQNFLQEMEKKVGRTIELLPGVRRTGDGHAFAEGLKENGYVDELA